MIISIREVVKTMLHARDPLFGGRAIQETMGLLREVGGYLRGHGSPEGGGGLLKRPWVS